jgi:hypothetical protein
MMTLANTVRQKLSEWHPPALRSELIATEDSASLVLTADRCEELGCLVWELTVRRAAPPTETLRSWAERIADRVTGLLEPLRLHEIDSEKNEALLRSEKATPRGDFVTYSEILLKGTTQATLRRYKARANGNGKRQQISFALTHDVIAKIAEDLAAAK